jgi:hypothetical protein
MSDLLEPRYLAQLVADSIRTPKEGAAEVLRVAPDRSALWTAFALMVVGSLFLGELVALIIAPPEAGPLTNQSSLVLGLMQGAFLFLTVHAITYIGRLCGGTGEFDGALALVTWLQFIFLIIQVAQLVLLIFAPVLAALVSLLAIGLFFWLLVHFITVLHGFESTGMVLVMTIVSFVSIVFALSIVLTILGLSPEFNFVEV